MGLPENGYKAKELSQITMNKSSKFDNYQQLLSDFRMKRSISLLISALYLFSCSTSKTQKEVAPLPLAAKKFEAPRAVKKDLSSSEALPISPLTVKKFRHLESFQGQLLIEDGYHHLVVAGIPPNNKQKWIDGVLAAFVRVEGGWRRVGLFHQLQFQVTSGSGEDYFFPIALMTDLTKKGATLSMVLQSKNFRGLKAALLFKTTDIVGEFSVSLEAPKNSDKPLALKARLLPKGSRGFFLYEKEKKALGATLYKGSEIFSLYSNQRGLSSFDKSTFNLSYPVFKASSFLSLAFGKGPHVHLPYNLEYLHRCLLKVCPKKEPPSYVKIISEAVNTKVSSLVHSAFLWDENGNKLGYLWVPQKGHAFLAHFPGSPLKVALQPDGALGFLRPKKEALATIVLPKIPSGSLLLEKPEQDVPVRVSFSGPLRGPLSSKAALPPAEDSFFVTDWPKKWHLPVGYYQVAMVNEHIGLYCVKKIQITEKVPAKITCQPDKGSMSKEGLVKLFAGEKRKITGEQQKKYYATAHLLGEKEEDEVKAIRVWNASKSLYVSLYPVTLEQLDNWRSWQRKDSKRPIKALMQFRDHRAKGAKVEIGCVPDSIGIMELEQTIRRLEPDVVEVFGCGTRPYERALMAALDGIMLKRKKPLYFSAASGFSSSFLEESIHLPRAFKWANSPAKWEDALIDGQYSLSRGVLLSLEKTENRDDLLVKVKAFSLVQPVALKIVKGTKVLLKQEMALKDGKWQSRISLPSSLKGWYRIEVTGYETTDKKRQILLATSNYLKKEAGL